MGIGEGYTSNTPIQLAQAMATLVNGGVMYKPRLVSYVDNQRTGERRNFEPEVIQRVPFKPEHGDFIKKGVPGVNKEGTGPRAFAGAPYTSGGKPATAPAPPLKPSANCSASSGEHHPLHHSWS